MTGYLVTAPRPKRVTLADVAAKAGVSVATASVAITGRPSGNCRVSPEVAERIRSAARALRYRPNIQARNLSTQRTRTVAMLIKRAAWHNSMLYVSAMQRLLRQRGYAETVLLHPDDRLESEREHLEACIERRVEGIIALPLIDLQGRANVELYNQLHRDEGIPVVHLGLELPSCSVPAVVTDEVDAIFGAVRLLHAMGHRRIAHATIPGYDNPCPMNPFRQAHLRYTGYLKGIRELGLQPQVFCTAEPCTDVTMMFDRSVELAQRLASAETRPTAIVTFSDHVAAGLMAGLSDVGISVPGEVSVLALGDQLFSRMLRPALSTLAPSFERMGELATQTLLTMIEGGAGTSTAIPPLLVMRQSVRQLK